MNPSIIYFYFIKFSTVVSQGGEIVQQFVKPFMVMSFLTHPVTMRFEDNFRFRTTILNYPFKQNLLKRAIKQNSEIYENRVKNKRVM